MACEGQMTLTVLNASWNILKYNVVVIFNHTVSRGPLKCSCKCRLAIKDSCLSRYKFSLRWDCLCDSLAVSTYIYINVLSGAIVYVYPLVHMCPSFQ